MTLKFETQPYRGTVNSHLSPRLTAKLTMDRQAGSDGGCAATATLVDTTGRPVEGVLNGPFNTSGEIDPSGTEVTFTWEWLSIKRQGVYHLQVTVLEFSHEQGVFIQRAIGTTDAIRIDSA